MSGDPTYMNIRFETLQQAQEDIGMAYAAIKATIDDLETQLNSSLAEWSGTAQSAYVAVQTQWQQALDHMNGALQQAGVHLASAHDMYLAVERQNVSIWHG